MNLFSSMDVAGSGLAAQRARLQVATENLANKETTQTAEGGPYRAKRVVLRTQAEGPGQGVSFDQAMQEAQGNGKQASYVQVEDVVRNEGEPRRVYDPSHPHADEDGYVAYPDIDTATQMTDLMSASRNYQANTMAVSAARDMALDALRIGR